jgi:hypothetical protein
MSWVAVGIGGSTLLSGAMSNKAAKSQQKGADRALDLQQQQFDTVRADTAPQREIGTEALGRLADILGIQRSGPSAPTRDQFTSVSGGGGGMSPTGLLLGGVMGGMFGKKKKKQQVNFDEGGYNAAVQKYAAEKERFDNRATGMDAWTPDPGYQFRLDNTDKTIDRYQSAGRITGGRAIKEAMRYGQDFASNEYGNSMNRLFTLAGFGNQGINTSASTGANTAGNMSNIAMQQGNIAANNYANINNSIQSGLQNYQTYRTYNDMNKLFGGG